MASQVHEVVKKLSHYIDKHAPKNEQVLLNKFLQTYFLSISWDELATKPVAELYATIYAHFSFMSTRQQGQVKLRVYNPNPECEGYSSAHSVIELVQDDCPFIVDSLLMELNRQGVSIHFIAHSGGVFVRRDQGGVLADFSTEFLSDAVKEANVYIEIDHQHEEASLMSLQDALFSILSDVIMVVDDFQPMKKALHRYINNLKTHQVQSRHEDLPEALAFLKWLDNEHFTFLGFTEFKPNGGKKMAWRRDVAATLGIMKDQSTYGAGAFLQEFPQTIGAWKGQVLFISKSKFAATVHRPVLMDAIIVREYNDQGDVIGEGHFLGLYTSRAYHTHTSQIPYLREKVQYVFQRSHFPLKSHDEKALEDIIENLSKDELFQMSRDELFEISMGILHIQERQQIRLFVRRDIFGRFYSCMVYLPRDLFNTELRFKFQNILMKELQGTSSSFVPKFLPSILCRIDFLITTNPNHQQPIDIKVIEAKLSEVARNWRDDLHSLLVKELGEHSGNLVYNKYARAFSSSYREDFTAFDALLDIAEIEHLLEQHKPLTIDLERDKHELAVVHLKLMQCHHGLWLTHVLPILENFGMQVIEERPYEISLAGNLSIWLSDFLIDGHGLNENFDALKDLFKDAFLQIWQKKVENDGFNRLVLDAGLNVREVVLLRAIAKYLAQIGFVYSQPYIEATLALYPELTHLLVKLFIYKFHPGLSREERKQYDATSETLAEQLKAVTNLDHDRIIRRFKDIIKAMFRTNYYQRDLEGNDKSYVSFKLNSGLIPDMPQPIPMVEIFVYAPEVEGVHLRGAKVSRGGLRWSDRREDFRTEVLSLMKAQQVKNAVIVPLGAKGGFYPKNLSQHEGRDAIQNEAIRCYKIFIAGLLDITDNIINNNVVPPLDVVRYDEDDPYLVVAADKGTASFSDIANALADTYQFWLGDAFASGGSFGYDHKKMGITAKGAWESVKRHFFSLNKDIQNQEFTCVGIGDMSGDVFGNGMLLSPKLKLIAAFNHLHIFLDPNPDCARSFQERQRLFNLPRSGWLDYNSELISQGGGVFARSLKVIPISAEVKAALMIDVDELEPNELIQAILKAPVELLWNGGIGTYVKASTQSNAEVGDRSNDALRIDATRLRCQVVGEGGNLGFTQLARVEFALNGGQICTDAIDNSAGVDCSDHEVNIKILLNEAIHQGILDLPARNQLLIEMESEVANLVLSDNYHQNEAISNGCGFAGANTTYIRLLRELEREGFINRTLEALPSDKVLKARAQQGKGFTKPEFAVLMAYAKNSIKELLLNSELPDEAYFEKYLEAEFPKILAERYQEAMRNHRLRREIITTQLMNQMVQYVGIAYAHRMYDEVGASPAMSGRAFALALDIFNISKIWGDIEALDGKVPARIQTEMMNEITYFLQHQCRWLLRHYRNSLDVEGLVAKFKDECREIFISTRLYLNKDQKLYREGMVKIYREAGVPLELAERVADFYYLYSALDIISAAQTYQLTTAEVLSTYYALSQAFSLSWLRQQLNAAGSNAYWGMLMASSLKDELNTYQTILVVSIINTKGDAKLSVNKRINEWAKHYHYFVNRWHILLDDFRVSSHEFVRFATLINCLRDLAEICGPKPSLP